MCPPVFSPERMESRPGNISTTSHEVFYLTGFSSLGEHRRLLSIPFFFLLLYVTSANAIVTFVIATQKKLYEPMYVLIGCMTLLNFFCPLFVLPRMVVSFATGRNEVTKGECLMQLFLTHFSGTFQGSVLVQMGVDRFFAICWPLRYHSIVNLRNSILFSVALAVRNTLTAGVAAGLLIPHTYCHTNAIYHCLCEHTSVVRLVCGNIARNVVAGVMLFTLTSTDCAVVLAIYATIFIVIFHSHTGEARQKAIHTCGTHLVVITVGYFCVVCAFVGYRVSNIAPDIRILLTISYLIIPCAFNPVIYGIRTKEIKVQVAKLLRLSRPKVDSEKS
ncbi:olfactory receptor 52E8-like [Engraulis encrasicolus]|uniref:olfactory receptor 52E8-like n=1 Tax=Engraulis encrasicolus TaxID=184585 RepID=UPI002FD1A58F